MRAHALGWVVCAACAPSGDQAGTEVAATATATDAVDSDSGPSSVREIEETRRDGGDDTGSARDDRWFAYDMPWTRAVDQAPVSTDSVAMIADLVRAGGWGNDNFFQIDFSLVVLEAEASTPRRAFETTDDWFEGDCDLAPVPIPVGGALEGEDEYACEGDGDCHLLVRDGVDRKLYEMWRANITPSEFLGGCLAIWDLDRAYDDTLRGDGCTSADAAGLPIAPLLFTADEVARGDIPHAIRFILPNDRIRHRAYVAPATHSTGATDGGEDAPPYGVRLRLRADYPLDSLPNEGARVVARALQKYGMFLADAGEIALTAADDRHGGGSRWEGLLGPHDLGALAVDDFEVVELGRVKSWDGECLRD